MEILEAIKSSSIFSTLEEEDLHEILKITKEKRFQEGDVIMQEGEKGDIMYLVVKGR